MGDQAEVLRGLYGEKNGLGGGAETLESPTMALSSVHRTRVIAVASGKGGVGKTSFSINLAMTFTKMGKKVVLFDADLGMANVNVMLGIVPKYNLGHLLAGQKSIAEIVTDTPYGVQLLAGSSGVADIANLSDDLRANFISEMSTLSWADIIIIDTAAGISSNVIDFILSSEELVVISTPEPTSVTDAYGMAKVISQDPRSRDMRIHLVVNRTSGAIQGKKVAQRFASIVGQFLSLRVSYLGFIPEDPLVRKAVIKQVPFLSLYPNCRAAQSIYHIAATLIQESSDPDEEDRGVTEFVRRYVKKKAKQIG